MFHTTMLKLFRINCIPILISKSRSNVLKTSCTSEFQFIFTMSFRNMQLSHWPYFGSLIQWNDSDVPGRKQWKVYIKEHFTIKKTDSVYVGIELNWRLAFQMTIKIIVGLASLEYRLWGCELVRPRPQGKVSGIKLCWADRWLLWR